MTGIVDYGVGNIFSIKSSLDYIGVEAELTGDPDKLLTFDRIILPGVGAFPDAMKMLIDSGMSSAVKEGVQRGIPLLGICLGMQLLFEKGEEYEECDGLGLIEGRIVDMKKLVRDHSLSIPQMGWNALSLVDKGSEGRNSSSNLSGYSDIFKYISDGSYVYFVHSYSGIDCDESVTATCDYSYPVTAAVQRDNVYGVQFHPEKSGEVGLNILKAFCEL